MVVVWQAMQLVTPTGMCVLFLPVAPVPLWQDEQLVATVNVLWSTLAPVQVLLDLWQVSQLVCPAWTAVLGLVLAWQDAHCVVMVVLLCTLAGVQLLKPALWQVSQLADEVVATS